MGVLWLLTRFLGWNVVAGKVVAGTIAMASNFVWNDLWTFRSSTVDTGHSGGVFARFARFGLICTVGIALASAVLHGLVNLAGFSIVPSNFLAIVLASLWNFAANRRWNWSKGA